MNRMERALSEKKERSSKILVAYYPVCDPAIGDPVEAAGRYFAAGADVLEMGLPCPDPVLDGPVVRDSMSRALEKYTFDDALDAIHRIRDRYPNACLQIMCYWDTIDEMGVEAFAEKAAQIGADAVLAPNIPPSSQEAVDKALEKNGLLSLRFVPYTLDGECVSELKRYDRGYLFLQAVNGETGARDGVDPHVGENIKILRNAGFTANLCAGFGVSTAENVRDLMSLGADGVIVGSAIIMAALENRMDGYISELRKALDR